MVPEHFTVVGREDDDGVFSLSGLLQEVKQSADLRVDHVNHRPVGGAHPAMVCRSHCLVRIPSSFAIRATVVDLLPNRFVIQFAFNVVRERDIV